ncbi:MAG: hypothetical protein QXS76_03905 [Candidatus Bathyarchaeia archaeon]
MGRGIAVRGSASRSVMIILATGVLLLLGIFSFEFLNPVAAILLTAAVFLLVFYSALKVWRGMK